MLATSHNWALDVTELKPALELVLTLARADMGILMLHDDGEGAMFPVLGYGLEEAQYDLFGSPRPGVGPFGRAIAEHQRVYVRNAWIDGDTLRDAARALGFRSIEVLPFFRSDGGVLGAFGVLFRSPHGSPHGVRRLEQCCTDVVSVALAHAEQQVRAERLRERMMRATEAKIHFLARLSHELRTPLQSITGYIDLLRTGKPDQLTPEQDHMLARITESEHILVHIIEDVITISRLEAGGVKYNLGPTSVDEAVRAAEIVVSPLAAAHNLSLESKPGPPNLLVNADPDKLKQILVNLAANAIKFTRPPGTVTLSYRTTDHSVEFDVADTGPGIAPDRLREIFDLYVQAGPAALDGDPGSGLGLTISREFATGMHGDLTAVSDTKGSIFTLSLPRWKDEPPADAMRARQETGAHNSESTMSH